MGMELLTWNEFLLTLVYVLVCYFIVRYYIKFDMDSVILWGAEELLIFLEYRVPGLFVIR